VDVEGEHAVEPDPAGEVDDLREALDDLGDAVAVGVGDVLAFDDQMVAEGAATHAGDAAEEVVQVANAANLYIDAQAPWTLKKTNVERMQTVLYVLAEVIRNIGLILQPFTPKAANKILDQVAVAANAREFSYIGSPHALQPGTALPAPQGVFPRYEPPVEEKTA